MLVVGSIGVAGLNLACSSTNIHRELKEDKRVLVRQWARATQVLPPEAGVRGTEQSNAVMYESSVIFGNQSIGLLSLYPSLNQVRWVLPLDGGVVSELGLFADRLFFGAGDGFLYCVQADSGRVQWRYELRNPMVSKPVLSGGRLFVTTTDDVVYAFDASSGEWIWHYRRKSSPSASIYGASTPLIDGNEVVVGLSDGFLVGLNIADGTLKWEKKLHEGRKFTDVDADPVLDGGVIYVPSYDGALYALKRHGGDVIWKYDAGGSKKIVIDNERILFPSSSGFLYALKKENGALLWKFALDGGAPTQLILTDHYVIFGSSMQYLYALDKSTGQGLYRYEVGYNSGFSGSPVFDRTTNRLFFLSGAGYLYSFLVRAPRVEKPRFAPDVDIYSFDLL